MRAALTADTYRGFQSGQPTFVSGVVYKGALKVDITKAAVAGSPALVILHGGGWTTGGRTLEPYPMLAAYFGAMGFTVFNADYTLGSGAPQTPIDDILDLITWIRTNASTYNADGTKIGVCGLSAGAHLAVMAACQGTEGTSRPDAICGWSTPGDLEEAYTQGNGPTVLGATGYIGVALSGNEATFRLYSPVDQITSACCPLRLVASDAENNALTTDPGLAVIQTTSLYDQAVAVGVPVEKRIITGTVHSIFFTGLTSLLAVNPNYNGWLANDLPRTMDWFERIGIVTRKAPPRAPTGRSVPSSGHAAQEAVPDFEEDFDDYADTTALQADPRGIYDADENATSNGAIASGTITLSSDLAQPAGNLKALRLTFADRSGDSDQDSESQLGKNLEWVAELGALNEMWLEFPIRFGTGWTTDFSGTPGDKGVPDHKTIFLASSAGGSTRWELKWGWNDRLRFRMEHQEDNDIVARVNPPCGLTNFTGTPVQAHFLFDSEWRIVRVHAKNETSAGANDGALEVWISDVKIVEMLNIDTLRANEGGFTGLSLGRNLNHIPQQSQWFEFGRIRVYKTNPWTYT